jgi:uncharacterized coiled-coil protein SlyX
MSPEKPTSLTRLETRIIELENLFTHQQKTIQDLHEVILGQQRRLDKFEIHAAHLTTRTESLLASIDTPRRPEDEKPPHY